MHLLFPLEMIFSRRTVYIYSEPFMYQYHYFKSLPTFDIVGFKDCCQFGNDFFPKNFTKLVFLIEHNKDHNEMVFVIHIK